MRFAADYSETLEVFLTPTDGISGHLYVSFGTEITNSSPPICANRQECDNVSCVVSHLGYILCDIKNKFSVPVLKVICIKIADVMVT
jgi:hypothetical protein